ncbi:tetratricopeptide repeat protein [Catenovulum sp. 2E275]|uniref:tetratricopeptide repeat protein n=1 Tax=Catenovulum sp. 2E275 TaxID=2980497 RepID=UPI0021CE4E42|nr:tetratricopeptide repeat protein [Catenovulum sp. 2E275]MCU4677721.1 tetratricopeptide repeat protein [Catenovulum sp. 2E275]
MRDFLENLEASLQYVPEGLLDSLLLQTTVQIQDFSYAQWILDESHNLSTLERTLYQAIIFENNGNNKEAIEAIEAYTSQYDNNMTLLNNLGTSYLDMGDYRQASKYFEQSLELAKTSEYMFTVKKNMAIWALQQGEINTAKLYIRHLPDSQLTHKRVIADLLQLAVEDNPSQIQAIVSRIEKNRYSIPSSVMSHYTIHALQKASDNLNNPIFSEIIRKIVLN